MVMAAVVRLWSALRRPRCCTARCAVELGDDAESGRVVVSPICAPRSQRERSAKIKSKIKKTDFEN